MPAGSAMLAVYKRPSPSSPGPGGSSAVTGGRQLRSRPSQLSFAPSVYGGAGGRGTRISSDSSFTSSQVALCDNEKGTMQNLNERMALYLDKVRSLEAANKKLELQIREFCQKKGTIDSRDLTVYFDKIADLQAQILRSLTEKHKLTVHLDNARLAADDFKMKFEAELNIRLMVEADTARLRGALDSLTVARSDLELQIESLTEELVYVRQNHEEEMQLLRVQQTGGVNVEMDCAESADLTKTLEEIRQQYEAVVKKNHQEVEKWFQNKGDNLQTKISTSTTEVNTSHTELSELKRIYQNLEIELQGLLSQKQCLEQNLAEIVGRYSSQLSKLQLQIHTSEAELQQLTTNVQQQATDYEFLLDIKMRLELEIAEYRRLLGGETCERAVPVVISQEKVVKKVVEKVVEKVEKKVVEKVVEEKVEEHKPHIQRRVKVIIEEVVDGKVVSTKVDTQVQEM